MERPPSQLENMRPSGIKQPSRLPALSGGGARTLVETSQSDLNARSAQNGAMLPPATTYQHKHKMSGCKSHKSWEHEEG